ncbi:MAG: hypothetical protein GOVbin4685_31 [Prokaryotic dsDNA virus sp.]|nr:MAG: hypothetical protein GOVbin4685_31 [Prokaryotic dsDNA virus sp.]
MKTEEDRERLVKYINFRGLPFTAAIADGVKRTNPQNALVHKWFAEIASHMGDRTAEEVKAHCNLTYGLDIMMRDPDWSSAFEYIFQSLSHAAKLKAIRVLDIPFTRKMRVPELKEYMDQMMRDYREMGIFLTDPELRGYDQ